MSDFGCEKHAGVTRVAGICRNLQEFAGTGTRMELGYVHKYVSQ